MKFFCTDFSLYLIQIAALKKLIAILLLAIYLFNLAGYRLLFYFVIQHADEAMIQRLDQDLYNEEDLIQIKIPINLPYYGNRPDYERINGEVNYKEVYYRYVKRKVVDDTLYILCLKNEAKTKLQSEQTDFAKQTGELPIEKQGHSGKKVVSSNEHPVQQEIFYFTSSVNERTQHLSSFASPLHSAPLDADLQPPEQSV